jgi:hypothetical protein
LSGDDTVHLLNERTDGIDVLMCFRQASKRDDTVGDIDLELVPWQRVAPFGEQALERLFDDGVWPREHAEDVPSRHHADQPSALDNRKTAQLPFHHAARDRPEGFTRTGDLHGGTHQLGCDKRGSLVRLERLLQLELLPYENSRRPWVLEPSLRFLWEQIRLRDDAEQPSFLVDDRQSTEVPAHHQLGNRLERRGRTDGDQLAGHDVYDLHSVHLLMRTACAQACSL